MLNSKERKSSLDIGILVSTILSPSCDLCFDNKPDCRSSSYEWDLWKRKLQPPLDFHCRNLLHYVNLWLWHGSVQVGMCFQLISAICGAQSCVKVTEIVILMTTIATNMSGNQMRTGWGVHNFTFSVLKV